MSWLEMRMNSRVRLKQIKCRLLWEVVPQPLTWAPSFAVYLVSVQLSGEQLVSFSSVADLISGRQQRVCCLFQWQLGVMHNGIYWRIPPQLFVAA